MTPSSGAGVSAGADGASVGGTAAVPPEHHRPIVSFAPRGGRMNEVQRRAWDAHAGRWLVDETVDDTSPATLVLPHELSTVSAAGLFGRAAPLVVEIGPGMGDATAAMAADRPEVNILAIEVYKPGVAQTFAHLARRGVDNVRVLRADAAKVLAERTLPGSLSELWLFFPDPWPKRRHHKRRIVTPAFADLVATRLAPGGSWYLATDWAPYAKQMLAVVSGCADLVNPYADGPAGGFAPRAPFRPETRFERRGVAADREIFDLHARRPAE